MNIVCIGGSLYGKYKGKRGDTHSHTSQPKSVWLRLCSFMHMGGSCSENRAGWLVTARLLVQTPAPPS